MSSPGTSATTSPTTSPTTAGPGAAGATGNRVREFCLPDLGEGLTESEIVRWLITEGETVELNQIIAEVETAKAVVELPSPYAGVVVRLHEAAGAVVDVGAPIASFVVAEEPGVDSPGAPAAAAPDAAPAEREPNLVGYGAVVEKSGRPRRRSRVRPAAAPVPSPAPHPVPAASPHQEGIRGSGDRPRSTPPVRKLARELGIPLDDLTGTGPGALITRADVLGASAGTAGGPAAPRPGAFPGRPLATPSLAEPVPPSVSSVSPPPAAAPVVPPEGSVHALPPAGHRLPPLAGETRTPIRGVRRHTAAAMVTSAFTAPHVTAFLTVDVTPTLDLLADLRSGAMFEGTRVTLLALVSKAVCIALRGNPVLNSSWDDEAQEIVQYAQVNLGIAAATPRGLLVPNIKSAQAMTLVELARAIGSLTETARAGRTPPADLAGGTLSITNIGVFGIDAGTPILNPGEAAILALGAVRSMPWEYRGEVALRSVMTLSLSFDHRLVDGEQGSRFLTDVGGILRNPAMALTMV